jgi:hypothetical protein
MDGIRAAERAIPGRAAGRAGSRQQRKFRVFITGRPDFAVSPITAITITNGGASYSASTTITITDAGGGTGAEDGGVGAVGVEDAVDVVVGGGGGGEVGVRAGEDIDGA